MEETDKILRKGFEDVTTNNVRAAVAHSNDSRKLIRELEDKVKSLDGEIRSFNSTIELMQKQIALLQAKLYAGGTA